MLKNIYQKDLGNQNLDNKDTLFWASITDIDSGKLDKLELKIINLVLADIVTIIPYRMLIAFWFLWRSEKN